MGGLRDVWHAPVSWVHLQGACDICEPGCVAHGVSPLSSSAGQAGRELLNRDMCLRCRCQLGSFHSRRSGLVSFHAQPSALLPLPLPPPRHARACLHVWIHPSPHTPGLRTWAACLSHLTPRPTPQVCVRGRHAPAETSRCHPTTLRRRRRRLAAAAAAVNRRSSTMTAPGCPTTCRFRWFYADGAYDGQMP